LARRWLLVSFLAVLVTTAWLRLEKLSVPLMDWLPMLLLALAPIAAAAYLRSRVSVGGVLAAATLFAASGAFDVSLSDARPGDPQRDFFGPVLSGIQQGFLDFYDTELPFDRIDYHLMHSDVLLAIFGFTALTGMLVMVRRPVLASLALITAVGWPGTLIPGGSPLRLGAVALVGVLAILFVLRREGAAGSLPQAAGAVVLLVVAALVASATEAVAKTAFLSWQTWDPYDRPTPPVSVEYVWRANYDGIDFPKKATTVMRVKASGARRSLYWRASTLDDYTGQVWDEDLKLDAPEQRDRIDAVGRNPLLPKAAADENNWVRQDITIEALRDMHLPASAQPVRWEPGTDAPVADEAGDIVVVPDNLRRDQEYTVWSYVPQPNPSELDSFRGDYPATLSRYLEVVYEPVPEWRAPERTRQMAVFFADNESDYDISALKPLYDTAREVTTDAKVPYEAALVLETWFRQSGHFTYDEHPPAPVGGVPALADFVTTTKKGYCQHYAGAMALMLRLLGIPSRVAVGFTSGSYNSHEQQWYVKDTNAHAWVEVWFPRFGWIPFDPTPGRGQLGAAYAASSVGFNAGDAATLGLDVLPGISPEARDRIRQARDSRFGFEEGRGVGNATSGGAVSVVRDRGPSLLLLLVLVLGGAYAAIVVLKTVRRSMRFATRDHRLLASACRRDLVAYLADQGVELARSTTLPELGAMLDRYYAVDADRLVRDLTVARFGPPGAVREALSRARRELREVRRILRGRLGISSRLRGAASLRSLSL
jgi:protein-glutamine gamma-glutamyltransferase